MGSLTACMLLFSVSAVTPSTLPAAKVEAPDPLRVIRRGMTEKQVEALLGERGGVFSIYFGDWDYEIANPRKVYGRSRLSIRYDPQGKVRSVSPWGREIIVGHPPESRAGE